MLVGALRAVPEPVARPECLVDLRARLVAEAASMPVVAVAEADRLGLRSPDPGRARPRERRVAVALGGFALVGATASLAVVAQTALPGDTLYPLKRGVESAHVGLTVGDQAKGSVLLGNATNRIEELQELAGEDADERPVEISDTMDDFVDQAVEASDLLLASYAANGDEASVTELRSFTATSMQSMSDLNGKLPASAIDEWVHAVTTLVRIHDSAKQSCPTRAGIDLTTVTPTLPLVGTGFGTEALPALDLPDAEPTGPALPSLGASELPPGSITKPTPSVGGTAGPTGGPTGGTTTGPTPLPTSLLASGIPTSAAPTTLTTLITLPTVDPTVLLSTLTGGPSLPALPTDGVTRLLGGSTTVLPTAITSPLDDLLP